MKLFWTIITIFALTAAAMVWAQGRTDGASASFMADSGALNQAGAQGLRDDPIVARTPVSRELPQRYGSIDEGPSLDAAPDERDRSLPDVDSKDALAQGLVEDLLGDDRPMLDPDSQEAHMGHQEVVERAPNPWMDEQGAQEHQALQHSLEQQPDGSTLVDGLFTMRGDGTRSSPYEITWDYLMSAAETYQPRLGMTEMPERIAMLDGKHVKIAGFLMFPMATFEAKEALVMLNMWDGCCIGTMPSPYDAIEVQFTQGVPSSVRQFASYGSVEGKLVVDPYLISDWLIGLYVLEDAALNVGM